MPAPDSPFWESPVLKVRAKDYPERFGDRVPVRIRMLMSVCPDDFCGVLGDRYGTGPTLYFHEVYEAWTNSHGAVCGICRNGFKLGVKPDEFEVVEWYVPDGDN